MPAIAMMPRNLQNVNSPDFDLERDLIDSDVALGMQATEMSSDSRFRVNISTILISAFIFLAILAWFDFIQTAFYSWTDPTVQSDVIPATSKLWYAILITIIIFILVVLIYYHSHQQIM